MKIKILILTILVVLLNSCKTEPPIVAELSQEKKYEILEKQYYDESDFLPNKDGDKKIDMSVQEVDSKNTKTINIDIPKEPVIKEIYPTKENQKQVIEVQNSDYENALKKEIISQFNKEKQKYIDQLNQGIISERQKQLEIIKKSIRSYEGITPDLIKKYETIEFDKLDKELEKYETTELLKINNQIEGALQNELKKNNLD